MMNKGKKTKKPELKLFVVRKYILANSAAEALRKERKHLPDDCWLDEEFRRMKTQDKAPAIGFLVRDQE